VFTVLAKTDHEAAEREIKEYVSLFPFLYNTSKRTLCSEQGFLRTLAVDLITRGGPFEDVLTVILPSHQLPSNRRHIQDRVLSTDSPQIKRFATRSRASIRRDILGVNADETSSLLSTDTYVTPVTNLKDNADSQSACTDTSADTITINEKGPT